MKNHNKAIRETSTQSTGAIQGPQGPFSGQGFLVSMSNHDMMLSIQHIAYEAITEETFATEKLQQFNTIQFSSTPCST